MIYKIEVNTKKEMIEQEIEAKAKEVGFGVLNSYNFTKILESKGFPIEKEITVFELCNPQGAHDALSNIAEISVYLPCRLSLYEENGKTILATIGFEDILNAVEVDEEFKGFMGGLFKNLQKLMFSFKN